MNTVKLEVCVFTLNCCMCGWTLKLKLLSYSLIYRQYPKYWKITLDPVPCFVKHINNISRTARKCPCILKRVCEKDEVKIHYRLVYRGYRSETQKYKLVSLELHVNIPQSGEGGSAAGSSNSSSSSPVGSSQGLHCIATTFCI